VFASWLDAQDPEQVSRWDAVRAADPDHAAGELVPASQFVRCGSAEAERPRRGGDIHDCGKREKLGAGEPCARSLKVTMKASSTVSTYGCE